MYTRLQVKDALILWEFNETWNFLGGFSKNTQMSNVIIIRPFVAEMIHADRQTDMGNIYSYILI